MARRIAVTGSSGLIGTPLVAALTERGDEVVRLVRHTPTTAGEVRWDPASRRVDAAALDGVDGVVHFAGAGVGDKRWTPSYKHVILSSRTDGTHAIASAIAETGREIRLVSGSAVGFYGDRGDEELTEANPAGTGFLTDVVLAWEASAAPAVDAGSPVAFARTGIVMSPEGGAMGRLLPLARLGLAGPLGSGRQFWPWITLADEVAALIHLLDRPDITGPVNLVGPAPARQRDVVAQIGSVLHRPHVLPAPSIALKLVLGEFASDILGSQRIVGEVLAASGFTHQHADLESAVNWLLG